MMRALTAGFFSATLATTLLAGSDDEVVQRLHVRFETYDISARSCRDVVAHQPEPGTATFQFRYQIAGNHWLAPHRYTGTVTFELGDIVIHMPGRTVWPGMTDADRDRVELLRRAIEHHEIGHVRVAEAVRDALNAQPPLIEPDLFAFGAEAQARGRDGFARFTREEHEYDDITGHGRRQHAAPGALAGLDSVLLCS